MTTKKLDLFFHSGYKAGYSDASTDQPKDPNFALSEYKAFNLVAQGGRGYVGGRIMTSISESIYTDRHVVIPMAEVQHIERDEREGYEGAINIIMSPTRWNFEHDCWDNTVYLNKENGPKFLQAWCRYRAEREGLL